MSAITEFLDANFKMVSPFDFYRDIFPPGELDKAGEFTPGKYTGIIVAVSSKKKHNGGRKIYRYSLTDGLTEINAAITSDDFCLCSPISYAGKERTAENARMMYAVAVDVDKIRLEKDKRTGFPAGMRDLLYQIQNDILPCPTYIVSSGTGIHLYYLLEKPLPFYSEIAYEMQDLKRELTRKIWNRYIVDIKTEKDIQQGGIYQGFRMPGTITKAGGRAAAYKVGERVTIEYLNSFVNSENKAKRAKDYKRGKVSLSEAEKKWPDWYKRRITNGEPRKKWHVSRNLYDWWKEKIKAEATVGHRYYCLMLLAVFAQKCSYYDEKHNPNPVTQEELETDSFELMDIFEKMTDDEKNHFKEDDVLAALEAFNERWVTYPRGSIAYKSGISIPANKRNGRKQKEHIKIMNYIRENVNNNTEWNRVGNGRKSQEGIIKEWQLLYPDGTIKDCIKETGLGKSTVYRHWDGKKRTYIRSQIKREEYEKEKAAAKNRREKEREEFNNALAETANLAFDFSNKKDIQENEKEFISKLEEELEKLKKLAKQLDELEDKFIDRV